VEFSQTRHRGLPFPSSLVPRPLKFPNMYRLTKNTCVIITSMDAAPALENSPPSKIKTACQAPSPPSSSVLCRTKEGNLSVNRNPAWLFYYKWSISASGVGESWLRRWQKWRMTCCTDILGCVLGIRSADLFVWKWCGRTEGANTDLQTNLLAFEIAEIASAQCWCGLNSLDGRLVSPLCCFMRWVKIFAYKEWSINR